MTFDASGLVAEFWKEVARLGLSPRDFGGLVISGDMTPLIDHMRAMQPGATWRDVFPTLPADWAPFDPVAWQARPIKFVPLGPFDYQQLPVGPALHIQFADKHDPVALDAFLAAARAAGFSIFGAGLISITNPDWPAQDAYVVMSRDIAEDDYGRFTDWIEARDGVSVAVFTRDGRENYIVD